MSFVTAELAMPKAAAANLQFTAHAHIYHAVSAEAANATATG